LPLANEKILELVFSCYAIEKILQQPHILNFAKRLSYVDRYKLSINNSDVVFQKISLKVTRGHAVVLKYVPKFTWFS